MKIIANSLPKSGTHLLTRILDLASIRQNEIQFSASLLRRTARNPVKNILKFIQTCSIEQGIWIDIDKKRAMSKLFFESLLNRFEEDTYSQGHLPYSDELSELLKLHNIKIIYIIRDPRDVLISHFHHLYNDKSYPGHNLMRRAENDMERITLSLYGLNINTEYEAGGLRTRLANSVGWYECGSENVLALKFEDLIGDKGAGDSDLQTKCLAKIEKFLVLPDGLLQSLKNEIFYTNASTFRKGQIGDWKQYYDAQLQQNIKKEIGEYLIRLGYEDDNEW